jgi:hypothetical protein
MVPYGEKHLYIFEPVCLCGPSGDIVVPIFFYQWAKQIYAKCIKPKYIPLNSGPPGARDFQMHIPGDIDFNYMGLINVPVSQFSLIYEEPKTFNGNPFMQKSSYHILSK